MNPSPAERIGAPLAWKHADAQRVRRWVLSLRPVSERLQAMAATEALRTTLDHTAELREQPGLFEDVLSGVQRCDAWICGPSPRTLAQTLVQQPGGLAYRNHPLHGAGFASYRASLACYTAGHRSPLTSAHASAAVAYAGELWRRDGGWLSFARHLHSTLVRPG